VTAGRKEMEERRLRGCALLADGNTQGDVARLLRVSRMTVWRWAAAVAEGADLRARKPSGRPSRLTPEQVLKLHSLWETRPKWTYAAFAAAIEQVLGVKYDADHVGRIAIRLGLRQKRVKKTDADRQKEWAEMFERLAHA